MGSREHQVRNEWDRIEWIAPDRLQVEDLRFDLVTWGSPKRRSTADRFVLVKDAPFAQSMRAILDGIEVQRVLEFGLYQGGSLVLLDALYGLELAVGVDARSEMSAFDSYVRARGAEHRLFPYLEVDQADRAKVRSVLVRHFLDAPADLIIDDASHLYAKSLATFELAFPFLRPGGVYIIEDWGWAHWPRAFTEHEWFVGEPLSKLVLEVLLIQCRHPSLIERVHIDAHHVAIYKGPAALGGAAGAPFRVRDLYLSSSAVHVDERFPG